MGEREAIMKYKVTIQLDEILKEKGISQYSLIKETHLSEAFIRKLVKHKKIANLDKLATIINTLNEQGANIRPSDLIKFVPADETTIKIIASQTLGNSFYFFFKLKYQGRSFFDPVKITVDENNGIPLIRVASNDTPLYNFNTKMQKAISAQSFYLGEGINTLVQLPSSEKKVAAQAFAEAATTQALKVGIITKKPTYTIYLSYFSDFAITFNHAEQKDNTIHIIKDKNDSLIPYYPEAYQATYPFLHTFSVGRVEKGEHFTKPNNKSLSKDKDILAILAAAFNNK